jgi:hypothetical protein
MTNINVIFVDVELFSKLVYNVNKMYKGECMKEKIGEFFDDAFAVCCETLAFVGIAIFDALLLLAKTIMKKELALPSDGIQQFLFVYDHLGDYALYFIISIFFFGLTVLLYFAFITSGCAYKARENDDTKIDILIKAFLPTAIVATSLMI